MNRIPTQAEADAVDKTTSFRTSHGLRGLRIRVTKYGHRRWEYSPRKGVWQRLGNASRDHDAKGWISVTKACAKWAELEGDRERAAMPAIIDKAADAFETEAAVISEHAHLDAAAKVSLFKKHISRVVNVESLEDAAEHYGIAAEDFAETAPVPKLPGVTFREAVGPAFETLERKNPRDVVRMQACLERHAGGLLDLPIARIDREAVAGVLKPLMKAKQRGAAKNLRVALSKVFKHALAKKLVTHSPMLPADVLNELLPNVKACQRQTHRKAVPVKDAPGAFAGIVEPKRQDGNRDAVAAARFMVLTGARSIEAAEAVAGEFDLDARLWSIPADRMKARRPHAVPLSDQAMAIVADRVRGAAADAPVFPRAATIAGSTLAILRAVRRGYKEVHAHGWRSTFTTWADDKGYRDEVVMPAIAHAVGSKSDQAYTRKRSVKKRRKLLQAWANYLTGAT